MYVLYENSLMGKMTEEGRQERGDGAYTQKQQKCSKSFEQGLNKPCSNDLLYLSCAHSSIAPPGQTSQTYANTNVNFCFID